MGVRSIFTSGPATAAAIAGKLNTEGCDAATAYVVSGAGAYAQGTATLSAGLAAAEKVTIQSHDFVARAKYATGTATLDTIVSGNKVTLAGVDFTARAAKAKATATLASLVAGNMLSINGHDFVARAKYASGTATLAGLEAGDRIVIGPANLVAKAKYASGTIQFSALDVDDTVTVGATTFTAKASASTNVQFAVGAGADDATAMANFVAKLNAHPTAGALVQATDNGDGTCTVVAVAAGADGNAVALDGTAAHVILSGATLEGAYDAAADEFPIEATDALTATALKTAINAAAGLSGVATADSTDAVVTVTAATAGVDGNAIAFSSAASPRIVCDPAGPYLAGAYDPALDEFPIETTDAATAAALNTQIGASTSPLVAGVVTSAVADNVVTVTAVAAGPVGNTIFFTKNAATLTLSSATLAGAADPALHEWALGSGGTANADSATALAAAINAAAEAVGCTASAAANVVTIVASTAGADGNAVTLTKTGAPITVSGTGTLSGAYDPAADEWPIEATLALSAAALAAAINVSTDVAIDGVVTASADGAVVTVKSVASGAGGDAYTLARTGAHIAVSGATLAGGDTTTRTLTVQVLADDGATVLYSQDVSVALSKKLAIAVGLGAASSGDITGIPVVLGRSLKFSLPAAGNIEAQIVAYGGGR